jgi:hypothetical protein
MLSCGRVAHPASFRTMTWNPSHVPRRGVRPTAWQKEIGALIAAAYGVRSFDPETFLCAGGGAPVGHPVIDMDLRPEEWDVFAPVNRDRGDSLRESAGFGRAGGGEAEHWIGRPGNGHQERYGDCSTYRTTEVRPEKRYAGSM